MAVTTPAVPASTTVVTNTTGQWVDAAITGGTMTNVSVNGVTAGAGAGNYALPPGGTIAMTYSVAPTWAWANPIDEGYTPTYSAENLAAINQAGDLPWPAHTEGGTTGLGYGVSN